jgi:hypothetical protein
VLTRRSAAAAAGVHTHTYSSAASETAATKKAPGLLLLPSLGPGACARMDTDTAACSSDNTPANDQDVHMIGCRLANSIADSSALCKWLSGKSCRMVAFGPHSMPISDCKRACCAARLLAGVTSGLPDRYMTLSCCN